jgi:hypothetical protein
LLPAACGTGALFSALDAHLAQASFGKFSSSLLIVQLRWRCHLRFARVGLATRNEESHDSTFGRYPSAADLQAIKLNPVLAHDDPSDQSGSACVSKASGVSRNKPSRFCDRQKLAVALQALGDE